MTAARPYPRRLRLSYEDAKRLAIVEAHRGLIDARREAAELVRRAQDRLEWARAGDVAWLLVRLRNTLDWDGPAALEARLRDLGWDDDPRSLWRSP